MKTISLLILIFVFQATTASDNASYYRSIDFEKAYYNGGRFVRSIDSILDTLVSLESPSAQSESQSANTNNRPHNVPYTGGRLGSPNLRQSRLFSSDTKNSKGSRTSISSQHKRPNEKKSSLIGTNLSQGQRRFDNNFAMIPFPYPPPFGAFPGFEHNNRDSKQSSFPQSDRSTNSYGFTRDGNGINDNGRDEDFYENEYPNTKYSMLPKQNQNPRHHKDHEILRASGYPSSKVFYPSHGMPSPKEISIPMFSQGNERGLYHLTSSMSSRYGHEKQLKPSYGDFDEIRDVEKSLGLEREPLHIRNQDDYQKGQLAVKSYEDGLFSRGDHTGHRYGDSHSAYRDHPQSPSGLGQERLTHRDYSAYRYGDGQQSNNRENLPGNKYGEGQSIHRDHSSHRYGEGQSDHGGGRNSGLRQPTQPDENESYGINPRAYEEGHFSEGGNRNSFNIIGTDYPSNSGAYNGGSQLNQNLPGLASYAERQLTNNAGYGHLVGQDVSGYEGYGVGPSSFPNSNSIYSTGTKSIWRGYGESPYGNDDKTQLTSINAAALQALDGITALDRDASHSSYGMGGLTGSSNNNQYKDLSNYPGLFASNK